MRGGESGLRGNQAKSTGRNGEQRGRQENRERIGGRGMRDRKGVEKRKAGLTKGSTGATEAEFLTLPK